LSDTDTYLALDRHSSNYTNTADILGVQLPLPRRLCFIPRLYVCQTVCLCVS